MKNFFFLATAMLLVAANAYAAVERRALDLKLPTQVMLQKQTITTPILASATRVKTSFDGPSSAEAATITSFSAQPDVPRNITITPGGTTTDVETCNVVVTGTNIFGDTITETLAFAANANSATAGAKAFKTVTSVLFPADCESGGFAATWTIGVGDVLGLSRCMDSAGHVAFAVFDGAYETTRPTCIADADEIEKNTCDINGALNGSKNVELYFIQNFRCMP